MTNAQIKLSWNPISYNDFGDNNNIRINAKHNELIPVFFLSRMIAVNANVHMAHARTAEGVNPVINVYPHSKTTVITYLNLYWPNKFRGNRIAKNNADNIPICSPLNASIWDIPAPENSWRVESSVYCLSPSKIEMRKF